MSPADGSGSSSYHDLLAAGFHDVWIETHPNYPGLTAQPRVDLQAPIFGASQRIDYVLTRGEFDDKAPCFRRDGALGFLSKRPLKPGTKPEEGEDERSHEDRGEALHGVG